MVEQLARVTAGAPFGTVGSATNADRFTTSDLMAAVSVANLTEYEFNYALVKGADFLGSLEELTRLAMVAAQAKKWAITVEDKGKAAELGWVAMLESLWPAQCKKCGGVGQVTPDAIVVECQSCAGKGTHRISERALAEMLGVSRRQVRQRWGRYFAELMADNAALDGAIGAAISHKCS